jgi:hypothetical protein
MDIGVELATKGSGMIDKNARERQAIKDARRNFAETLIELGLIEHFATRPAEHIDQLIESCVDGFQRSMINQPTAKPEFDDAVPF